MPKVGVVEKPLSLWNGGALSGVSYVGIDPGASGGMAVISPMSTNGKTIILATGMPDTERDVWEWLRLATGSAVVKSVIEKVSGFIGKEQPGSAMFKFGQNYGFLRACLIATGTPFEDAAPQRWQKALGITRSKKESRTQWKNRLKGLAQQIFPQEKVTLATADAMLIAEYARRFHEGKL